jgi:DNA-binding NarL/FixJ family response regulator
MIRGLIADDALVRLGLADLLGSDDSIEVVFQATDGLHAVELATAHHVDATLVDVRIPHMDGITATAHRRARPFFRGDRHRWSARPARTQADRKPALPDTP